MIIHILEDADMAIKEKLYQQSFEDLEKHKMDAYAEEVSYQVLHFHQSDLRYIDMLKQLTAAEEWESVRETLLCAKTVQGQRLELMAKEKLFDRLWILQNRIR